MNILILVHCVSSLKTEIEEKKTRRKTRRKKVVAETLANLCNQPVVEILMQRNLISLSGEVGVKRFRNKKQHQTNGKFLPATLEM